VSTETGRVRRISATSYSYEHTLTDHLGNGRVYFDMSGGAVRTIQETDYYAFGLDIQRNLVGVENKFQYNGKEKQDQEKMYDYGARLYDPVVGRFTSIDPIAEHFPWMTSYQYASNDPIKNIDLDGLEGLNFNFFLGNNSVVPRIAPLAEATKYTVENVAKAGGEIAGEVVKNQEEHHVIPRALRENPFVKEGRQGGFKFEGKENKIGLEKFIKSTGEGEHGSHPKYTTEMLEKIGQISENNKGSTPIEKAGLLRDLVKDTKDLINNNRGSKINDLFKKPTSVQDNTKVVIPNNNRPVTPPKQEADPRFML
jgi:RHS repeat-associated protein